MTEQAHELFEGDGAAGAVNAATSIKEKLRIKREEIAANRTYDVDLPGYDGDLYARYRLLTGEQLNGIANRVVKTVKDRGERGIIAAIDTILAACVEMRLRDGGRDLSVADYMQEEEPVRYDLRLAEFLDFAKDMGSKPTARDVLRDVFVDNDIAIAAHNSRLSRWMMSNGVNVDEELMADFG